MTTTKPHELETRLAVLRRMAKKFLILCVAMTIVFTVGELLLFHFVARNGWLLNGPGPTPLQFEGHWQARFGDLPPQMDEIIAPVGRPPRPLYYGREYGPPVRWYRIEDAAPAEEIATEPRFIMYSIRRGPDVPHLQSSSVLRHPLAFIGLLINVAQRTFNEEWGPAFRGDAYISSDGRLWCEVRSRAPFFLRIREYVGTVDEFMPPSSARGWKTTHYSWTGLTYNVALLLILFGWMFFVRDVWILIGYKRYRARMRKRRGLCVECGYDLQGHKDGRCPECGKAMVDGPAKATLESGMRPRGTHRS